MGRGRYIHGDYSADQRKPVEDMIGKLNKLLLDNMTDIVHIHIYGFSFSDIDIPYIEKIVNSIDCDGVIWEVTYYDNDDAVKFRDKLIKLGVPQKNITMTTLEYLNSYGNILPLL